MTRTPVVTLTAIVSLTVAIARADTASNSVARPATESGAARQIGCTVIRRGTEVQLQSPAFILTLDIAKGLRAQKWENRLADRTITLGNGNEVECDFDAAEQRIWISGWKSEGEQRTTHVFLPLEARDKDLTLTLGGFGMYDYREIDATINGQFIGVRHALKRWNEPGVFDLGPKSKVHSSLRFGQDNILVIHCKDPNVRTERMDQLKEHLGLPGPAVWPAQFEQYLTLGTPLATPRFRVKQVQDLSTPEQGEARVELESDDKAVGLVVNYRWNAREPILHKSVEVRNQGQSERRLMNLRLGEYATDAMVSEGEQGFPVYFENEFFASIAHPAGWAIGQDKRVILRQYPGHMLKPNDRFNSMEVVLGTAKPNDARHAFVDYVRSRTRRVVRGHDKPYAIYDTFGANADDGRQIEKWELSEKYVLEMLDKLGQGQREAGYHFDLVNTHFWVDHNGDLERFDPVRFPGGFTNIKAKLDKLGITPGLWISSSWAAWSIGGNPVVGSTRTHDPAYENDLYDYEGLCLATDPIRTMFSTAFCRHIRDNGIRLIKCDEYFPICYNPNHPHLPGVYSTEAIGNAVIQTFQDWDAASPDVFVMLYWGFRSPWWLLHGDTIFDPGLAMEAASPGPLPTLYARDGVTVQLDRAQRWCEDVPVLGKDSLGIWLSDWGWNSRIGKERWQEGMVMDLCRGYLLAQVWTDYAWLSTPERKQLAEFIALLKAAPQCFANPRFILGDVWKHEPYGYSCSDGRRTFLALNNCSWSDLSVPLELNAKWGLPDGGRWDIYRWYPSPAKLRGAAQHFGQNATIGLRPFDVVLLEVVPAGESPSLDREFTLQPMPDHFSETSLPVELTAISDRVESAAGKASPWRILEPTTTVSARGAVLTQQADRSVLVSGKQITPETYTVTANTELTNITAVRLEVLPDPSLPQEGPGRSVNGNFVLSEFRVNAAPVGEAGGAVPVVLQNAVADFSQETYGGWPVAAALDGDPKTGWQIAPLVGAKHEAVFEMKEPAGFPGGTKLTFLFEQTAPTNHALGRFRLAVTSAKPPLKVDLTPSGRPSWRVSGQSPACPNGGTLVISTELSSRGKPFMFRDAQARFTCRGVLDGEEIACEPVVHSPSPYPASWQAWRIKLKPSDVPQLFEFRIDTRAPDSVKFEFKGHYIPSEHP